MTIIHSLGTVSTKPEPATKSVKGNLVGRSVTVASYLKPTAASLAKQVVRPQRFVPQKSTVRAVRSGTPGSTVSAPAVLGSTLLKPTASSAAKTREKVKPTPKPRVFAKPPKPVQVATPVVAPKTEQTPVVKTEPKTMAAKKAEIDHQLTTTTLKNIANDLDDCFSFLN